MKTIKETLLVLLIVAFFIPSFAQDTEKKGYEFTVLKEVPHTAVPNQYRSGTCWSFSGIGFLEAEILRLKGDSLDLSEMFLVRNVYSEKAEKYVRLHGNLNLGPGGGFSDVIMVLRNYGLVPETAYSGLEIGEEKHVHGEMDEVLKAYSDAVIKNKNKKLSPVWHKGFDALLDTYLGKYPTEFKYDGKNYTPESFAKQTKLNPDDYIELTSYSHQELYKPYIMEIPDNWMWSESYNISLDELLETIDNALNNGYTVAWDADVSEKGFSWKNGVALIPEENPSNLNGTKKEQWDALTQADKIKAIYSFEEIVEEQKITPEMRQQAYDNYTTTDDHNMLFIGIAKDQLENKYYKVKNSWGTEDHIYKGYFYASVPFVQCKTISIMLHKDAIPKTIRKKLDL